MCYYCYMGENPDHHLPFSRKTVASAVKSWESHGEVRVASRSGRTGGGLAEEVKST